MYGPLKFALIVSFILILILIASPFAIFIYQLMSNPKCIEVAIEDIKPLNGNAFSARVVLHYSLDIPLRRVRVMAGDKNVIFENITRGVVSKEVILTPDETRRGVRGVEIEITGFRVYLKFLG